MTRRLVPAFRALGSLVVLVAFLGGPPVALLRWGRSPLPPGDDLPGRLQQMLTSALDDHTLLGLATVAGWIGWAVFAASVEAELAA